MARFLTFEGGEAVGKSTQVKLLHEHLLSHGHKSCATREPGDTRLGAEIRKLLLTGQAPTPTAELFLFLSDRAEHVEKVILPALDLGSWVISDRYSHSTAAYQIAGRNLDHGAGLEPLLEAAEMGVKPDFTIWLDLPTEIAAQRLESRAGQGEKKNRLDMETIEFHDRVRAAFHEMWTKDRKHIIRIDASDSVEAVHEDIVAALSDAMPGIFPTRPLD